eukprot:1043378-Prorocentrum_minimum.AAC.1
MLYTRSGVYRLRQVPKVSTRECRRMLYTTRRVHRLRQVPINGPVYNAAYQETGLGFLSYDVYNPPWKWSWPGEPNLVNSFLA